MIITVSFCRVSRILWQKMRPLLQRLPNWEKRSRHFRAASACLDLMTNRQLHVQYVVLLLFIAAICDTTYCLFIAEKGDIILIKLYTHGANKSRVCSAKSLVSWRGTVAPPTNWGVGMNNSWGSTDFVLCSPFFFSFSVLFHLLTKSQAGSNTVDCLVTFLPILE